MRDGAGSSTNGQGDGGAAVVEGVGMFAGAVAICGVEDAGDVDEAGSVVMLLPLLLLVSTSVSESAALVLKMLSLPLVLAMVLALRP